MGNMIRINVFNTLESDNVSVSGWYSYKNNPNQRYGLFTRTTGGLEDERLVYNMKFMIPDVNIPYTDQWQICIKIRHCDSGLTYEHIYRNWNEDISIGWLRPGQLGGETVNWFFNGENDCWYHGGPRGYALVVSHRVTCGNIPPSVMQNATEENKNTGGQYVRPDSGQSSTTSNTGGQYVRPDSGQSSTTSNTGGQYVRPNSGQSSSGTNGRLYPTGKGQYMEKDDTSEKPQRVYPTPFHEVTLKEQSDDNSGQSSSGTNGRLYPTGKGQYMEKDSTSKNPQRLYPTPFHKVTLKDQSDDNSGQSSTTSNTGGQYVRPDSGQSSSTSNKGGRFVRSNPKEDSSK